MKGRQITPLRLAVEVVEEVGRRATPRAHSATYERCLRRYFRLLEESRGSLRGSFTEAELAAIVDAYPGLLLDNPAAAPLASQVREAIRVKGLDKKWQLDPSP